MSQAAYFALLAVIIWAPHMPRGFAMGATVCLLAAAALAKIMQ